jgi:hypothetical protein
MQEDCRLVQSTVRESGREGPAVDGERELLVAIEAVREMAGILDEDENEAPETTRVFLGLVSTRARDVLVRAAVRLLVGDGASTWLLVVPALEFSFLVGATRAMDMAFFVRAAELLELFYCFTPKRSDLRTPRSTSTTFTCGSLTSESTFLAGSPLVLDLPSFA